MRQGVDLVDIADFRRRLEKQSGLLERLFTPEERTYCETKSDPVPHLAARFAAKEAFFKAMGFANLRQLVWTEVGVINRYTGEPALSLAGEMAEAITAAGIHTCHVSLSHTSHSAIATVLLEG